MILIKKYLIELKQRGKFFFLSLALTIISSYINKELLLYIIIKPIILLQENCFLYFILTNATEVFIAYINIIIFLNNHCFFFLSYLHIIDFILSGLYNYEAKIVIRTYINFICCWIICLAFWYKIFIPLSWTFFMSFQLIIKNTTILLFYFELKLIEYLDFFINIYKLPLITSHFFTLLLIYFIYIKKKFFYIIKKRRKKKIFFIIIVSTIFSTPDIISQIILSIFYVVICEIIILNFIIKNKNKIII